VSGFRICGGIQDKMVGTLDPTHRHPSVLTAEELCEAYAPKVCRFAALMSNGAEADDLAQEALLRAVRSLGSYQPERGTVEAWLWRIVANAAKDSAGRRRRMQDLTTRLGIFAPRESESVEDAVLARLRDADLHAHLRRLRLRDRTLLALRYGVGLDIDEVGAALGLSGESAGKAIRRALARLRARLEASPE
jgi:RNA polymerase sigma-70 factor (ECF subfamily)